jgi:hypothetical protein
VGKNFISIGTSYYLYNHYHNIYYYPPPKFLRYAIEFFLIVLVIIGLVIVLVSRGLKILFNKNIERTGYDKRVRLCRLLCQSHDGQWRNVPVGN